VFYEKPNNWYVLGTYPLFIIIIILCVSPLTQRIFKKKVIRKLVDCVYGLVHLRLIYLNNFYFFTDGKQYRLRYVNSNEKNKTKQFLRKIKENLIVDLPEIDLDLIRTKYKRTFSL